MYRAAEVSVHRACCERATQPYSLGGAAGGEVRFLSRLKTSRCCHTQSWNGNRVFTHSLYVLKRITMSLYEHAYVQFVFAVSQFHADVYLVYLVFQIT